MAKAKLGTGARFAALTKSIAAHGNVRDPAAVAAAIGRKKYGTNRFQQLAAKGRKLHGSGVDIRGKFAIKRLTTY